MKLCVLVLLCLLAVRLFALENPQDGLKLPALFGDHMVLQRGMPVPIWGEAMPGQTVTLTLGAATATARTDMDGNWRTKLGPLEAGGPFELVVNAGTRTVTLHDVLVGEVWLCSGQSNMQFGLSAASNAQEAIAGANFPQIRSSNGEGWTVCSPQTAPNFSAMAYFFGRELHQALKVPVGLLVCAVGGSPAETWISPATLQDDPTLKRLVYDPWQGYMKAYPKQLSTWMTKMRAAGKDPSKDMTGKPAIEPDYDFAPGNLYAQRITPVAPYAIKGALWYQGESNAWGFCASDLYATLLPALIRDWRKTWGQGDFPFITIQLPNAPGVLSPRPLQPSPWTVVQEVQAKSLALPNTALVVTTDLGENDIHPKRKEPVGQRAALAARKLAYGETLVTGGSRFAGMTIEGKTVRLRFTDIGGGLVAQGGALQGFTLAGEDRVQYWATATIDGDSVVLSSDEVPQPVAARYAFAEGTPGNLCNVAGLPASPFRTDNWPLDTPPAKPVAPVHCPRVATPPAIDGVLDDAAWAQSPVLSNFTLPHSYRRANYRTEVRLAYDTDNLYVAFRCEEPRLDALATAVTARDDEKIWQDDTVELFLDPGRTKRSFFRYSVNAGGAVLDGRGYNNDADGVRYQNLLLINDWRSFDKGWDGPCTLKTGREAGAWTVEMAIPWSSLGVKKGRKGQRIGLQLARTHANPYEESAWLTLGRDYNTGAMMPTCKLYSSPARYAELVLD